jgi:putative flippase GtrA
MRAIARQFARFGAVGLAGLVIDLVVFNLLRTTVFQPDLVHNGPLFAKIVSTSLAIIANWLGNRYWTFGSSRRQNAAREGIEFVIVSLGGMGIALSCLWMSHYVLGFTSVLADNIASNVVGLALGTAFRFVFYRSWVFSPARASQSRTAQPSSGTAERPVRPAGFSPLRRVQAVAPIEDRSPAHE